LLRQKQKKLIMLPSETMIWQPEFTDKTLSRKPGAVHTLLPLFAVAADDCALSDPTLTVQAYTVNPQTERVKM
ncbi:hypothetical protein J7U57_23090, partial [Escherichia coli]|nr:hypothetical protein [Escherichia coli]MBO9286060.1 hypothetical protein [Escherichia coli]